MTISEAAFESLSFETFLIYLLARAIAVPLALEKLTSNKSCVLRRGHIEANSVLTSLCRKVFIEWNEFSDHRVTYS